ncbi:MAG: GDSL-like Lipase/Acylhydrolase family [Pseudomonadota bacterium]|jgi:lysophospholipase L1-like esterase
MRARRHRTACAFGAFLLAAGVLLDSGEGRARTIDAIGDSITAGYVRSDGGNGGAEMDPGGGYPGRLGALLADGVVVRNRGAGGSTARLWVDPARSGPSDLAALLHGLWPDLPADAPLPRPQQGPLSWTLAVDRPDAVLFLLGVNDLWLDALRTGPPDPRGAADRVVRAAAIARATGARALVATVLPNERDSAAVLEEFNRRLCEREPDCVPLGARFRAAGGTALLGDEIHPSQAGHQAIAEVMADALVAAGLAQRRTTRPGEATAGGAMHSPVVADPLR